MRIPSTIALGRARQRAIARSKKAVSELKYRRSHKWKPQTPEQFARWSRDRKNAKRNPTPAQIAGYAKTRATRLARVAKECTPHAHAIRLKTHLYCNLCHRRLDNGPTKPPQLG